MSYTSVRLAHKEAIKRLFHSEFQRRNHYNRVAKDVVTIMLRALSRAEGCAGELARAAKSDATTKQLFSD